MKGNLLGIITATINPEKFYAVTGGALPQNLNFASYAKNVPTHFFQRDNLPSSEPCTVATNQKAIVFIKATMSSGAQGGKASRNKSLFGVELGAEYRGITCVPGKVRRYVQIGERRFQVRLGSPIDQKLGVLFLTLEKPFYGNDQIIVCLRDFKRVSGIVMPMKGMSDGEEVVSMLERHFGIKMKHVRLQDGINATYNARGVALECMITQKDAWIALEEQRQNGDAKALERKRNEEALDEKSPCRLILRISGDCARV